ncbi:MAG: hypothetical protein IJ772_05310 [Bacilli bacterium]|nr:hypothetical protein [Bacilli bacterium]
MEKKSLVYKDETLSYQPFHDKLRRANNFASSKNISNMFSVEGFNMALQNKGVADAYAAELGTVFQGAEDFQRAYTDCVKRSFREHSNPYSAFQDVDGNEVNYGLEGWGATAVNGDYNAWTRLAPVLTAGYLARCRALEAYLVITNDKPTFHREYAVTYVQHGLNGERMILPQAIRAGKVAGMTNLPLCEPQAQDASDNSKKNTDNKNVYEKTLPNGTTKIPMIAVGTTGNLMDQSTFADGTPIDKTKFALERQASIDYVAVKFPIGKVENVTKYFEQVVHTRSERVMKEGKTSERIFNEIIEVPYTDTDGNARIRQIRLCATIDLDTGYYQIMSDGLNEITHIHFKVRVTNVPNEMSTYMTGIDKFTYSFDIENKIYGSIPVIPEMNNDFNAAGEGVSWVAFATDQLTETYSGIRDNDLEEEIDESFAYRPADNGFRLAKKLGGYKFTGTYPLIPRHPGGSDDILAPQRMSFKHYMTRVFTRSEKYVNFDHNIQRQWIVFANDEDVDILPDTTWTTGPNAVSAENGSSEFRYGFSLDDAYGWMDNHGRKVRVIGSKDIRWLDRSIWAVQKSLTIAAPTTVYFPYMFRVFSSISPDMRNRPAMLFATRDAKRVATLIQARIQLEGNDLNLYSNASAFAAGLTGANPATGYNSVYGAEVSQQDGLNVVKAGNNVPNYNPEGNAYSEEE